MAKKWYVAHTYAGHELKAKKYLESAAGSAGLEDKFGQILVPTESVSEMKSGKRATSVRKFLPSYILIEMEMTRETQALVVNTPSITNFVGGGGRPVPLSNEEVEHILHQIETGRTIDAEDIPYKIGDQIKVVDGPFSDFSGVVSEVNEERKKAKVMISVFGRPTPVELDFLQIQRAEKKKK